MDELHSAHQGISAIKSFARSYVWWPGIDRDLENKVKECATCQQNAASPPAKHVYWPIPEKAWDRIHIDHAGPVEGRMLLVIVDAKTKWLEVVPVPSTSSSHTIRVLQGLFACFGIPRSLVSDNGPSFTSGEFSRFLRMNGISRILTAPYHPNSNGLAERAVRTIKAALKKVMEGTLEERVFRFLFNYRNTPHASTGISPAVAMFGRPLRTRLDILKDLGQAKRVSQKQNGTKFNSGDLVWVRNFRGGPKWIKGKILVANGLVMFEVKTSRGTWSRHADQIRLRKEGNITGCPLSLHSDPAAAIAMESEEQLTPFSGSRKETTEILGCESDDPSMLLSQKTPCDSDDPPVLLPQEVMPVVPKEKPPVLSPQSVKSPRRSSRIRNKPDRLKF